MMVTAPNRREFFNQQEFTKLKSPGTYRIFTLGGSTTYGRPYDDTTSFAGWLREFLPLCDSGNNWEVINAGGISYASYRVAYLMEELIEYQPDLFIIYTGHNEFLEERTYGQIKEIPSVIRSTGAILAKTRTWSAMTAALQGLGLYPEAERKNRSKLSVEVDTILDRSAGLKRYTREDSLQEKILHHYEISLERMVGLARSVGAQVVFVTPAAQLNDCVPFKSEHTQGLDSASKQYSKKMLMQAKNLIQEEKWDEALELLEKTVTIDPRHAELQYRRGQVLLAMGRFSDAETALRLARDEDVCPLRALTPMRQIVTEIARDEGVGLVDFVALLERQMEDIKGHSIPGKELFLDHVHPTIEGHKILAVALIESMIDQGLVRPGADWGEQVIAKVEERIEDRIDPAAHGMALANLARVLFWAKKTTDAERLARQALGIAIAQKHSDTVVNATSILASVYMQQKKAERATELLYTSLEELPGAIELRLQLGQFSLGSLVGELEKAAAHLLFVSRAMPDYDNVHALFGMVMAMRGRPEIAYPSLMQALRINPNNNRAQKMLAKIRPLFKGKTPPSFPAAVLMDAYSPGVPKQLVQVRNGANGNRVRDGIEVEFYENGRLKRFLDISKGQPLREDITWDMDGSRLEQ